MARRRRRKKAPEREEKPNIESKYNFEIKPETRKGILVVFLIAVILLSILSFFDLAGALGGFISDSLIMLFGWGQYLFPIFLAIIVFFLLGKEKYDIKISNWLGLLLFALSFLAAFHLFVPLEQATEAVPFGKGGGYVGVFLSLPLQKIMGKWATLIVLIALVVVSLLLIFNTTLAQLFAGSKSLSKPFSLLSRVFGHKKFKRDDDDEYYEEEDEEDGEEEDEEDDGEEDDFSARSVKEKEQPQLIDVPIEKKNVPIKIDMPLELLNGKPEKPTSGDIKGNQHTIKKTLENFSIDVEMGDVSVGPTVTQYTLKPAEGVKLAQITTLHNDLSLALAAHPIRIEAPIPGKSLVGIEVPNKQVAIVNLKEILQSESYRTRKSNLSVALGKDVAGRCWVANLDTMPHLLIAGATGSGKTVSINAIIISLLFQSSPADLRFIMVDPKRVELPLYNGIPHLLTPVITEIPKTINALKWTIREMERRFELLSKMGKRNIQTYNKDVAEKLPYIVFIIDELADLMATSAGEVEGLIVRLAQMARAVGIHLILATQRPSVEVITGLIKANITTRIAFSVASLVDSRTILDTSGAEKLLGRGDMLYMAAELSKPKRLQGAYVDDKEIQSVVDYLKKQGVPDYNEEILERPPAGTATGGWSPDDSGDELLDEAKEVIIQAGKASASLLQRRLKVGYARAARLLDLLEDQGLIGPADGAKPRELYLDQFEAADDSEPSEEDDNTEYEDNENEEEESEESEEEYEEDEEDPSVDSGSDDEYEEDKR